VPACACRRLTGGFIRTTGARRAATSEEINVTRRSLGRRIESLLKRVAEHEAKVRIEESKAVPDLALIRHWKVEISAFAKSIERARRRLGR
jgi:hypothetical protein